MYLNLVLEFVPETVYKVTRHYSKAKQTIPMLFIKVSYSQISTVVYFLSDFMYVSFHYCWLQYYSLSELMNPFENSNP